MQSSTAAGKRDVGRRGLREGTPLAVHLARLRRRQRVGRRQADTFDQFEQGAGLWMQHRRSRFVVERVGYDS